MLTLREIHVRDDMKKPNLELNVHFNLEPTEKTFKIDNKRIFEFDRKNIFKINGNTFVANAYIHLR